MKKILLVSFLIVSCSTNRKPLCGDLHLSGTKKLLFDKSELKLLCGDPRNAAWDSIPTAQRIYHLKTFLLERGFYAPKISEKKTGIFVEVGPKASIDRFSTSNWPKDIRPFTERRFRHLSMVSKNLDEIEAASLQQLKSQGYPCAEVKLQANPAKGLLTINATPGSREVFGEINGEPTEDLDTRTLRRFRAFHNDDIYDYRLLDITEKRIQDSGLVQNALFLPHCGDDAFSISQKAIAGKSRFLSIGAGFDTEQLAIAQARISFNRLSEKGSSLESLAYGSLKIQSLQNKLTLHLWPPGSRTHLYSDLDFEHRDERSANTLTITSRAGAGITSELKNGKLDFEAGPKGEYIRVYRGDGLPVNRNISIEFATLYTSHLYEYNLANPKTGYKLSFNMESSLKQLGATFTATKLKFSEESLWQLWDNRWADLVLATRGFFATTYSHEGGSKLGEIPVTFRNFLGGSDTLRGFGRLALPRSGMGSLSAAYFGSEFRLARMMKVEPIVFADLGSLSNNAFKFGAPYFFSPGVGFRWLLPIGVLRGTAARGYTFGGGPVTERGGDYNFYLSYGEEF